MVLLYSWLLTSKTSAPDTIIFSLLVSTEYISNPSASFHLPDTLLLQGTFMCSCSVAQSRLTLWDPMDCSTPGFLVPHHLTECVQTHVHWVGDDTQPSHPPPPPSPTFNLSQHQGLSSESALHIRWPKYWSSASASVFPVNIQDWSPLGLTSWISLQSRGVSRVFSNTTVQKPQFFGAQLSLQSNSHTHTWPLEKP